MLLSDSILSRLEYQHQTICELIKGFSEKQLKHDINTGKWSIFENIIHLCAYQPIFIKRIDLMLQTESPSFERYIAENDSGFYECLKLSIDEAISKINADRTVIISKLKGLDEDQLNKTGCHPKYGLFSISKWTEFFLLHEAHHLWTIMQLSFSLS
ncbi:MAG TPA: DinB family protein [Puia sp.]|nr:DinB family protein [Puia sp.]